MDKETMDKFIKELQKLLKKYKVKLVAGIEPKIQILPDEEEVK
jgi:hypothetical protein